MRIFGIQVFSRVKNFKSKACNGQSLIEILIGLTIGALLIGGAVTVIMVMVNSEGSSWKYQTASAIARSLLEQIRLVADSNWYDIYDLEKGSGNAYYPVASSTTFAVLGGKEGVLQNDIREGLVGYWKFDEATSSTAYDSTGNNNNGIAWNNPTKISPCRISSCFNFDGTTNYIEINDLGSGWLLDLTDSITVTAWIKPTNVTSGVIVAKAKTGGSRYVWELSLSSGYFFGKLGGGEAQSNSSIPINVWSYVVMTYDKNQAIINIYINGMPAGSDTETGNIQTSDKNLGIAKNVEVSGSNYLGFIDDVRIYNQALTSDEIKILYDSSVFTRYFFTENTSRDINGNIESSYNPTNNDPSTQKITAVIEWFVRGSSTSINVSNYITRWKNKVFQQTDWTGAAGETEPITEPNNRFSSSSGISTSTGSIRIQGL